MRTDIERWNRKYEEGNPHPEFEPDSILTTYQHLLDGKGKALDLACGVGQNTIFLAKLGYDVVGIDGSIVGLRYAQEILEGQTLSVSLIAADLDHFVLPTTHFDLVLVIKFLNRRLIGRLKRAMRPGGLLIYKTFNRNYLQQRPSFPQDYVLDLGELTGLFEDFHLIATNDSPALRDSLTYWIGRKH